MGHLPSVDNGRHYMVLRAAAEEVEDQIQSRVHGIPRSSQAEGNCYLAGVECIPWRSLWEDSRSWLCLLVAR